MIERTLSKKIKYLISKFPVISLTGPRQSGKTTLVKNCLPGYNYVNMEDMEMREFASEDPKSFLSKYNNKVIIDEVQRIPELFSYIQTEVDKSGKTGQFILTGSQNMLLQQNIAQSLAGRVAILKLLPLSMEELKEAGYGMNDSADYMYNGFYPRIYDKKIVPYDWYGNYIQTYVERDVRLIKNITDLQTFQKFLKMCAGRIGQSLNLSSLGNDCGITHNTAKAWISLMESCYVIFLLQPYYKNYGKRLTKMPKLYFYDTGLACHLLGIQNKKQLNSHYLRGGLFEAFVISEIMKYKFNRGQEHNCYFWRDKTGNEIDCIIEKSDSLMKIEIKSGNTITESYFSGLEYWKKIARENDKNFYLIYNGENNQKRNIANIISWKEIISIFKQ